MSDLRATTGIHRISQSSWTQVTQVQTWVVRQVREADGLALHLVGEATQGHADLHLLGDVLVLVGGSLKHDGDLPVHVCLGKLAARLPRAVPEDDLDVICGSHTEPCYRGKNEETA